jgi:MerR family transcriptional regulator, copper efflux regulator
MSSPSAVRLHLPLAPSGGSGLAESSAKVEALRGGFEAGEGHGDEAEGPLWQVGELAKASGKTVRAIHLYEELGLLRPHARSKGRFRLFGPDALVRVRLIAKLQELGLSLGEIQGVVRSWESATSAPGAMRGVREVYRAKLRETREQIARLSALESELSASLAYLETCDSGCEPAQPHDACPSCRVQPTNVRGAPELVAGFHAGYVPPASASGPVATAAGDAARAAAGSTDDSLR